MQITLICLIKGKIHTGSLTLLLAGVLKLQVEAGRCYPQRDHQQDYAAHLKLMLIFQVT